MSRLVTDEDLVRARADAGFRQQLLTANLDRLLNALKALRKAREPSAESARQINDGVALAVELADRLQQVTNSREPRAA